MHLPRYAYLVGLSTLAVIAVAAAVFAPAFLAPVLSWTEYPRLILEPLLFDIRSLPAHTLLVGLLLSLAMLAALAIVVPTSWLRSGPGSWLIFARGNSERRGVPRFA